MIRLRERVAAGLRRLAGARLLLVGATANWIAVACVALLPTIAPAATTADAQRYPRRSMESATGDATFNVP